MPVFHLCRCSDSPLSPPSNPGSFREQLSSYLQQLNDPGYLNWVSDSIEKEKLKGQHLQVRVVVTLSMSPPLSISSP